jgi:hypothetical protein
MHYESRYSSLKEGGKLTTQEFLAGHHLRLGQQFE